MKMLSKILALITLLLFTQVSSANDQPKPPQTLEELKSAIEKIRKDTNTPGVGIALVNKDGPYWIAGLGEANTEKHVNVDENTLFALDSISKIFASLSVLKLVEEKKLLLDDKLQDLAPEIAYENKWEKTNPVLLVHILEHTTGWDEVHLAEINFKASDSTSLKHALDFHSDSRTSRWIPGTRYAYNSTGPAVAAYIVEKISGKTYEDYVKENFFTPLGMNTTSFYKTSEYDRHGAVAYNAIGNPENYAFSKYRPSGSLHSSTKEMANLLQFFINRGEFLGKNILDSKSIERMEKPTSTLGNAQGITAGHGLNNLTKGYEDFGYDFHGHDGGSVGSFSEMMYSPSLGEGYVVMTNTNNGSSWQITQLVMSYLLRGHEKKVVNGIPLSSKLNTLAGIYIHLNPRIEITRFTDNIESAIKISVSDNKIHRSPIFGGWESNDYAIGENLLVNPWTGLPSIAVVNDPLAGETLQVEGDLYKRIPAVIFYGGIALFLLLALFIIANFLFAMVWLSRMLLGKITNSASIKIRIWPLLASLALFMFFILVTAYGGNVLMGILSWVSIGIFITTVIYPIFTIISLITVYKYRNEPMNRFVYVNAAILSVLLALLAIYFTYFGITGFMGWVV
ncbi:MAG: class A beta-lactamase-related serine hydrolase [Gammaproteobacteria bacterium]|nr:MAG: class A beta-lactamase-related serine hydrolase [Gammaproteobacteria bacterium]